MKQINSFNDLSILLIIIAISFLFGKVFKFGLRFLNSKLSTKQNSDIERRILKFLIGKITMIFTLIGIYISLIVLDDEFQISKGQKIYIHYLKNAFFIFSTFYATRIFIELAKELIDWYLYGNDGDKNDKIADTIAPLFEKIVSLLIIFIFFIVILDHFGVNIGSLLVSLGVVSLAIALAAQETLANIFAGIVLVIDRPFHVGDRIQLPTGEVGDVSELGLRSTKILNFDRNIIIVPNTELVKNKIINFSYPSTSVRVLVEVPISYESDLEKSKNFIMEIAKSYPEISKEHELNVYTVRFETMAVVVQLICFTNDYNLKFDIETEIRDKISKKFQEEKIEMPSQSFLIQRK